MRKTIIMAVLLFSFAANAAINDADAVRTIVGEAGGEPYNAQVGIGNVILNRGSIKGFYGFNNAYLNKQPASVWTSARKAWAEAKTHDITHGCKYAGGEIDDKYFQNKLGLKPEITIGHVRFYKAK